MIAKVNYMHDNEYKILCLASKEKKKIPSGHEVFQRILLGDESLILDLCLATHQANFKKLHL